MLFLNALFLYGIALIGIPILIHLIRKRKIKVIRWAAMEFLLQSQRKQRRRLRIEELILLLLRILIVVLAVLAFARPVLRVLGIPLLSQNTRIYAVIVLDNSFSMGQKGDDGKTSFERAQAAAEEIAAHILKAGDSASVILLSDKPEDAVGEPSFDLKLVRQKIHNAQLSDRATDYQETAKLVLKRLKVSTAPAKEVYWLSDDQASAWATSKTDSARAAWSDMGKQGRVTWISAGEKDTNRENLAVGTPTLGRQLVTPKIPASIEAKIFNYGTRPRSGLLVNLYIDDKKRTTSKPLTVRAGGSETAQFTYQFVEPGTHTGRIEINDPQNVDGLQRDNSAPFVVRVRDSLKTLVQDIRPTKDPAKSESFYLMTALAPGGETETIAPKLREGEGFGNLELRDYDVIVITGATALSPNDTHALTEYVKAGGGLLLFPGPYTDADRFNDTFSAAGLLPAHLATRRTLEEDNAITLNPGTIAHPSLANFKETSLLNIGTARFTTYYPLEPGVDTKDANAIQVMLRFSNNDPAFVERKVGHGRVILAASSAGANWNQLPLKASYVPMLYQIISYLGIGPTSSRNLRQNEQFSLTMPLTESNKSVRVTDPKGKEDSQSSKLDAGGVSFAYKATEQAGVYHLAVTGGKTKDAFAVSLPPDESNLTYADPHTAAVEAGLPANELLIAASPSKLEQAVRQSRYGTEIWRPFIWTVIGLLFLESLLANLFGRRG